MDKRILCMFLTLCLLLGMAPPWARAAVVASGDFGNSDMTWELDDAGTLTISGRAVMADPIGDDEVFRRGWDGYIDDIKTVVIAVQGTGTASEYTLSRMFQNHRNLTNVTIFNDTSKIESSEFDGCSNLKTVTLPNSITEIRQSAFNGCDSLTDIYYDGTQTQWKTIQIDQSRNSNLINATIHCTDGVLNGGSETEEFAISPTQLTLAVGQTQELTVTTDETVRWSVSNDGVAALSAESGKTVTVTAVGVGKVAITAETESGKVADCVVTVSGIVIQPQSLILDQLETASFTLYTFGEAQDVPDVDWRWSIEPASGVATIEKTSAGCNVQAVGLGDARITCTNGVYVAKCELTVGERETKPTESAEVTLSQSSLILGVGQSETISATATAQASAIQWSIENPNIATISSQAFSANTGRNSVVIKGVTVGETVLKAQVGGGPVARCRITVSGEQSNPTPDAGSESYLVEFDGNGGGGSMYSVSVSGTLYLLPENGFTPPEGKRFRAWTLRGSATEYAPGAAVPINSDLTVIAQWESDGQRSYLVEFDANGGGGYMNSVSVSGDAYALPENGFSPPYGMIFRAWRVEDESGNESEYSPGAAIPISSDLTVTALWEKDGSALAQGYCGAENGGTNLTWTLSRDWNLTIRGTGDMASYDTDNRAPWYGYHTNIQTATLESGVTSVGSAAFTYCAALEELSLPDTLRAIGENAFLNCSALESVRLPSSLRTLGDRAFYGCEALQRIDIPAGVSDTGNDTFEHCASLRSVTFPDSLTRVGYYAFYDCGLTSVTLPESLLFLDVGAFSDCADLRNVSFPASLQRISERVFENCAALESRSRNVRYAGTVEQFAAVAQTLGSYNEPLKAQVVHCSDGDYDWTPPDPYRILDRLSDMDDFTDQVWRLAGPLSGFQGLSIDERLLTRASELTRNGLDYTAEEGSTKLTVPAETFQTIGRGTHTIGAEFSDGAQGVETREQQYTVFPLPGAARIDVRDMAGVTGVEKVAYGGRFRSDPVLLDGLFRFHVVSGEVPPGLTLQAGGYFTGVAQTAGAYSFTVGLQIKRDGVWPLTDEDTATVTVVIEPGTEVKVETASDPNYEIVVEIPDQVVETETPPDKFELVSQGPFEEFYELYVDGNLIPDEEYEVRPIEIINNQVPSLLDGGAITGTYLSSKSIQLSEGLHPVNLTFQHKDKLGNTEIKKSAQTVKVTKQASTTYSSSGGGPIGSSGSSYYSISKSAVSNGSIQLSSSSAKPGATVTITATPAAGYAVSAVTVTASNKKAVPVRASNGKYVFTMPSRRVTVSATFARSTHTATVEEAQHGAVSLSSASPAPGDTVTLSTAPDKGYLPLSVIVRDADGVQLPVKAIGDGAYTFVMPSGNIIASANFTPKRLGTFSDILGPYWFFDDAEWAYYRGILRGVTDEYWEPETKVSGVTSIVTLERLDGVDLTPYDTGAYDGLDNSKWYVSALRWARTNGICEAYRTFSEYEPLTRGEYAVMLCNFLRYRGLSVSGGETVSYADSWTLTEEQRKAFQFLQFAGVFQGYEDGTIRPGVSLNRAQLAVALHRLSQYIIRTETRAL